jgi:hypothetical protein
MSPEQALGKPADHRSDIFSSGIVLWEMLTAQMVYSADNVRQLVDRVRLAEIKPPSSVRPEIPQTMDRLTMQAMAKNPENRFQSAHEFQVELTKFLSSSAPDYGAAQLSELVERVMSSREKASHEGMAHLVKEDMIEDVHSVIAGDSSDGPMEGHARLVIDNEKEHAVHLLGEELTIGRAGDLSIPDARISRRHARIWLQDTNYLIEDLGSANGTFVNEMPINEFYLLKDRDVIRIGGCHIVFRLPVAPTINSPVVPGAQPQPIPKLIISCGPNTYEKILNEDCLLTYRLVIGPAQLEGVAGRVIQKNGGFWLEPVPGREHLRYNGVETFNPVELNPGDCFQVGEFNFEFRIEA